MKKIITLLSFAICLNTNAQICFNPATNFALPPSPNSVASADFNEDGHIDLAVPLYASNNVSILLGTGTGNFGAATTFAVGTSPYSITIADFNGDGHADLATVNSNNVSVLLGTGTGSFGAASNFAVGTSPNSITNADFNGDGHADLVVVNMNSDIVSILLGTGTGSFGTATNFAVGVGTAPLSVISDDFNGDGFADLAIASTSPSRVYILLGTGTGSFGTATAFVAGSHPWSCTSADFNGDGYTDLAVANNGSSNVSVLLGTGTGSFVAANNFITGSGPMSVISADFNEDGRADLVVANAASNTVSVLLNNASIPIVDAGFDQTVCVGTSVTLSGSGAISYSWNNGVSNGIPFTPLITSTYTVIGIDGNGCQANDQVVVVVQNVFQNEEICLVTVDSTSTKNLIIWEKPAIASIDSFKIYREISSAYTHIANIPYSALSIFTDITNGINPNTTAYKYKITVVDSCGNESALSSEHRTIHVAISPASPCGYNLIWNDYIGFPVSQYLIYRDSSNTGWVKKDSVSFGNTSWTDFTCYPANDTIAYLVEAVNPTGCNPNKASGHNSTRSNVQRNYGVLNVAQSSGNDLNLKISPNPTNGKFTIQTTINNYLLSITNIQGDIIYKSEITNPKSEIDLSGQSSGVYIVSIKSGEKVYHQKLIKE